MSNGLSLSRRGVVVLAGLATLGVAATILVLRPASPVSNPSPAPPSATPCNGWAVAAARGFWPGGASIMSQVAPVSTTDVWAVGTTSVPGNIRRTLTEHWNGHTWRRVASPNVGASDNGLNDAAAVGPGDVWSVGYSLQGDGYHTLALHWDGSAWTRTPTPDGAGGSGTLTGVAASGAGDVWAVGHTAGPSGVAPLLLHWDGSAWRETPVAGVAFAGDVGLIDVAQQSPTNAWAVGYWTNPGLRPMILHWNGTRWSRVAAPAPEGQGVLAGVSISPDGDAWAVGYAYRGTRYRTVTERWDGHRWRIVPSPNASRAFTYLHSVAAVSNDNAWAVGTAYDAVHNRFFALSQHWNGSSWSPAATPNYRTGRPRTNILDGIAAVPGTGTLWATGVGAGNTLAMTRCASAPPDAAFATRAAPERTHPDLEPDTGPPIQGGGTTTGGSGASAPPTVLVPRAADVAAAAGIAQTSQAWTAVAQDMNGDGWPDVFVGRHGDAARLYLNDRHGGFTRVDTHAFPSADRHACAAADVNGDGRPDVFCGMGASHGVGIKRDELELQQADGSFTADTVPAGLMDPFGRTRRATFLDANGDGSPDLFIGGEVQRPDGLPAPNRLMVNDGHGRFHDAPELGLDHQIGTLSVQAADVNGGGRTDLLLAAPGGLHLYRNGPAGFTDVAASMGIAGDHPLSAQLGDLNGDGRPDLVEASATRLRVLFQRNGRFAQAYSRPLTDGVWVTLADVNGDGRPDLYVVQGASGPNQPDLMLLNEGNARFAPMDVPQAVRGTGDTAYALDFDRNGLEDVLVLNGHVNVRQGPLQLIAFSRS
jgi:hypothetical protein